MNLSCPECDTVYRIDPARVPHGGINARCRQCSTLFRVSPEEVGPPGVIMAAPRVEEPSQARTPPQTEAGPATPPGTPRAAAPQPQAPVFGPQDPQTRAKRLARALVSDIVVYNPDKWEESRTSGTLRRDFRDEILKSWEEYVEQVGESMAKSTPYFRDALNDILAEGERVF